MALLLSPEWAARPDENCPQHFSSPGKSVLLSWKTRPVHIGGKIRKLDPVESLTAASEVGQERKRGQTEARRRKWMRGELVESRRLLRTCTKAEIKVGFNKRERGGGERKREREEREASPPSAVNAQTQVSQ